MGEVISIECIDSFDPKLVRVTVRGPTGISYSFDIVESDYAILAMLPGFPANPCGSK